MRVPHRAGPATRRSPVGERRVGVDGGKNDTEQLRRKELNEKHPQERGNSLEG